MIRGLRKKKGGFTLMELLASSVIMAMLGTYTWMTMRASFQTRETVEQFADLYDQASSVTSKVSQDLQQAFLVPSHQNLTYFIGKSDDIQFTSLAHSPLTPQSRESEQTEITYKTQSNTNRKGLNLLLRKETRFIDGPKEEKETLEFETLTGHLDAIVFEYSKDGVSYVKQWDSTGTEHKNQLPKIMKLSITMKEDPDDQRGRDPKEVILETYIDIPMSAFYTPPKPKEASDKKSEEKSSGPQPSQGIGPGL